MKKLSLCFLYLLSISVSAFATNSCNLYEKLREVNVFWEKQNDFPKEIYDLPTILNEKEAIRTHLRYVEQTLRSRNVANLSLLEQKNRLQNLDFLHQYWQAGNFPINDVLPYRNPIFIDKKDNFCAVGYLIKSSGNEPIAREIQSRQNFSYLLDIQSFKLEEWVKTCGLRAEELAWIQPSYPPTGVAYTMNNGLGGTVRDMKVETWGELTAVGDFSTDVANWYSGFAGWDWFADCQGTDGTVYAIEKWNNERIIGGDFTQLNGQSMAHIAKLNSNTGQYEALGTLNGTVKDLKTYNNNLYAAGTFGLAMWNGTSWDMIGATTGEIKVLYDWNNTLVLGGDFSQIGGVSTQNIATYQVSTGFQALAGGLGEVVNDVILFKNKLYAGTDFVGTTRGIWGFDGNIWKRNEFYSMGTPKGIYALATDGEALYIGGDFTYVPMVGNDGKNLITMHIEPTSNTAYFNGMAALDSTVYSLQVGNNQLFVGGVFNKNATQPSINLNSVSYFEVSTTPIAAPLQANFFHISPNPTFNLLTVKHLPHQDVAIFDMTGNEIVIEKKAISDTETQVDVRELAAGIYVCKVGNQASKWIKQ